MTTRKRLLDSIEIVSPCSADWDAMKGTDQIRYCSECNKYVYNLSEMTRREAKALLLSRGNQMCARLIRDLEGQTFTMESARPVRLLGWTPGTVANAVVSAIISITPGAVVLAHGQSPDYSSQSVDASGHKKNRPAPMPMTSTITGIVTDEKGAAMSGAVVTLTVEASGEALSQLTSAEGEFRFEGLPPRTYIMDIRFTGYRVAEHHDINLQQGEARRLDVAMEKLIVMMGVAAIPEQPLRSLYQNSDRVVVAQIGKSTTEVEDGSSRLIKTQLICSTTIKGDGHKPVVDLYRRVYGKQTDLTEDEIVLAFLRRREDAKSHPAKNDYTLVSDAESVKHLSPSGLGTYRQRLEELKAIGADSESHTADLVEWLVKCAEDPVTRREGAFELIASVWREKWQQDVQQGRAPDSGRRSPRDEEPIFVALLTNDQKRRLVDALLATDEFTEGEFDLIELAARWNEPRLLPFLVSYLRRNQETAPQAAERVMESVADLLDDEKVSELFDRYTENASYEDSEDGIAEDPEEDAQEEAGAGDETAVTSEETDSPEMTPEAAKQARVEMLKKFLDAVEVKIKLLRAN